MTAMLAGFLGLGGQEVIVILIIVLLLFGAKKLPELARGLGKSLGEFKKAKKELEDEIKSIEKEAQEEPKPSAPKTTEPAASVEAEKKEDKDDSASSN